MDAIKSSLMAVSLPAWFWPAAAAVCAIFVLRMVFLFKTMRRDKFLDMVVAYRCAPLHVVRGVLLGGARVAQVGRDSHSRAACVVRP